MMMTQADIEQSIPARFEQQAACYPSQVAVKTEAVTLTYDALNRAANRLAHALLEQTSPPSQGDHDERHRGAVTLLFDQGADVITAFLGGLKAGLTVVPLDPAYPASRTAYMLEDSQASLIVTDTAHAALAHELAEGRCGVLNLDTLGAGLPESNPGLQIHPETFAYILYTSGSTGTPKGVIENHRNVLHFVWVFANSFPIGTDDRLTLLTSCSFSASMADIFSSLLTGASLHLYDVKRRGVSQLAGWLQRSGITIYHSVPTVYRHLVRTLSESEMFPALKLIYLAGEPIYKRDVDLYRQYFPPHCRFLSALGSTEMKIFQQCFIDHQTVLPGERVPVGYSVDDTAIVLLDEQRQPLKGNGPGEIAVRSPYMCPGYWRQPDLTEATFIPDPALPDGRLYRTGDLGQLLPDGSLVHLGRQDAQVKVRGYRVELKEVETTLLGSGQIDETVVTLRQDRAGNDTLVAYVVPSRQATPSPTALQRHLQATLPDYMVPSTFVMLETMPVTPSGKIDRKSLPDPAISRPALEVAYTAPRTPLEITLSKLWAEVLELDHVGIHDPFLDLGGHSLLAVQLNARVFSTFGVEIPLTDLLSPLTVSDMASLMTAQQASPRERQSDPVLDTAIGKRAHNDPLPLSSAQQRLWFLDQIGVPPALYTIARATELQGVIHVQALQQSLDAIVARHESLRTTFESVDGQPVQVIHAPRPVEMRITELQGQAPQPRLSEAMQRRFDLGRDLMLRAELFKMRGDQHILLLLMHHIAGDAWSVGILFRELGAFYDHFAHGKPLSLSPLPIQYADYALWQRQWLQGERLDTQLTYWQQQLRGAPASTDLPGDHPRPAVQTYQGNVQSVRLSPELTRGLTALSQREGVTLFVMLLASLYSLFYRYTGQDDMVIGTPVAGRQRVETEGLIGLLINTVLLRADMSSDPAFLDFLQQTRHMALEAFANQDMPFEQLIEALQPQRNLSHAPLFQILLSYQNSPRPPLTLSGLTATPIEVHGGTARFDVTLTLWDEPGGFIKGELEYGSDLFDPATIDRLLGHWQTLLNGIVADPAAPLSRLPLLTETERQHLLGAQDATAVSFPDHLCVHELIAAQVMRNPEAIAVVDDEGSLTYRELEARANQLAHHLQQLGAAEPDRLVALAMSRSRLVLVGLLGILKAGAAYVPLDPAYPAERIQFMLDDSNVSLLVTDEATHPHLPEHRAEVVCLGPQSPRFEHMPVAPPVSSVTPDHLAYVIYTSGSTGQPKGVQIAHRALVNFLHAMQQRPGICSDDVLLAVTTLSFDIAGLELFLPLSVGARVVLAHSHTAANGEQLARKLADSQATMMQATPVTWRLLLESGWQGQAPFRILCGGEALPPELARQLAASSATVWNLYGPTETTIWSMAERIDDAAAPVSLGTPIDNTRIYLLDRHLQPVPQGVPGEICIAGAGLSRGYLHRPELTAERFTTLDISVGDDTVTERLYRTGDLARYRPDGTLAFLGRLDHQVKIRGFRIELGEIESRLHQHPDIDQAVALAHERSSGDPRLVAYVVSKGLMTPAPTALRQYLQASLPDYMVPSAFVTLDSFPLTANGKIDRKALPHPLDVGGDGQPDAAAPQDTLERQLAEIWAEVLGVRSVGIHDDFFVSGGHSLLAVRLFARMRTLCGIHLPLATLFQAPTVAQLATLLRQENWTPPWSSLVTIQPRGSNPPLYCIHAHGGHVLFYAELAQYLDAQQPVYGLQAYGLDGAQPPHTRVEEMASHYIEEIRTLQPQGPYCLAGFCFGGLVAYEMAQQLQAQGQVVSFLALFDANATGARPRLPGDGALRYRLHQAAERVWHYLSDLWFLEPRDYAPYFSNKIRNLWRKIRVRGTDQMDLEQAEVQTAFQLSIAPYTPHPYAGYITLFKASMQGAGTVDDPYLGWSEFATGGIDVHTIPGYRETMLEKPRVQLLARRLQQCLDDAPQGHAPPH